MKLYLVLRLAKRTSSSPKTLRISSKLHRISGSRVALCPAATGEVSQMSWGWKDTVRLSQGGYFPAFFENSTISLCVSIFFKMSHREMPSCMLNNAYQSVSQFGHLPHIDTKRIKAKGQKLESKSGSRNYVLESRAAGQLGSWVLG